MGITRRKVLIVEDELSVRNALFTLLAGLGCDGDTAYSGRQALTKIGSEKFDAVLLDLRCSGMVADEVVARIHEIRPSLVGRVLVITGEFADSKTMDLIERHFLLQVPRHRILEDLRGMLRALLGIAPAPTMTPNNGSPGAQGRPS